MSVLAVACDAELAVWLWAKNTPAIRDAVSGQIHFSLPNKTPAFPALVVERVGGGPQVGELLVENVRIQFSCWAKPGDKATSARVAAAIQTAAYYLTTTDIAMPDGSVVTLHGGRVDQVLWVPDAQTTNARHNVDVIFTLTTKAA